MKHALDLAVLVVPAALCFIARPAHAGGGLSVSPVTIDAVVRQSGASLTPITVKNVGDCDLDVTITFAPLGHNSAGEPTEMPEYAWVGHSMLLATPSSFHLARETTRIVQVTVTVPPGRTGGAYAFMYVLGQHVRTADTATVETNVRVAGLIELALPGPLDRSFRLEGLSVSQRVAGGPVTFTASVSATGNVHVRPGGSITISDGARRLSLAPSSTATASTDSITVNNGPRQISQLTLWYSNVFPRLTRQLTAEWVLPPGLPPGRYRVTASVNLGPSQPSQTATGILDVPSPGRVVVVDGV